MRTLLLQILFAISFGIRYLLSQRWPSTSNELDLLSQSWVHSTPWNHIEHLPAWRMATVVFFFLFLISWSYQLKDSDGKRYSPAPLYLLHLFPISLVMGFTLNPTIGMITLLFLNLLINQKYSGHLWSLCFTVLSASAMCLFEPIYACCSPALLWSWRKNQHSKQPLWLGLTVVFMLLSLAWNLPSDIHINFHRQFQEMSFLMGKPGIAALAILSLVTVYQFLRNEREQELPLHWILLLIPYLGLVATSSSSTPTNFSLMISLLCLLAIIHQVWLRHEKPMIVFFIFLSMAMVNWGPPSGLLKRWQELGQHQHQLRKLAETWSSISDDKAKVLLCNEKHLLSLLKVHQKLPCLLYPPQGPNKSFLHIGQPGLLIRVGATGNIETPHLESAKPWKQLNVQRQGKNLPIRIDTFEQLILPF